MRSKHSTLKTPNTNHMEGPSQLASESLNHESNIFTLTSPLRTLSEFLQNDNEEDNRMPGSNSCPTMCNTVSVGVRNEA